VVVVFRTEAANKSKSKTNSVSADDGSVSSQNLTQLGPFVHL